MKHIVLVLGCHRSGTSLIAKALECLGAELGPCADWKGTDNEKGFWEDQDVLVLDQLILDRVGHRWDDPRPLDIVSALAGDSYLHKVREAAVSLLKCRTEQHPIWALKEPHLCILLDFWRPLLQELGYKVSIVHAVRHPMAVAMSLEKRNWRPREQGLALWLRYNQSIYQGVDDTWKFATVWYDALMTLPMAQVERLGYLLGMPVDEAKNRQFSRNWVDDTLWHEVSDNDVGLPLEVATAWSLAKLEALK